MDFITKIFGAPVKSISPADAQKKLGEKNKPLLLDVRQPEEFQSGHISGAKLIPLGELKSRLKELPQDREIICVCQSGSRSVSATRLLEKAGYNVVNLNGGMYAWSRQRLPVTKGK